MEIQSDFGKIGKIRHKFILPLFMFLVIHSLFFTILYKGQDSRVDNGSDYGESFIQGFCPYC